VIKEEYNNSFLIITGEHFWEIFSQKGILDFVYKKSKRKYIFLSDNYGRTFLGIFSQKGILDFVYKMSKRKK